MYRNCRTIGTESKCSEIWISSYKMKQDEKIMFINNGNSLVSTFNKISITDRYSELNLILNQQKLNKFELQKLM